MPFADISIAMTQRTWKQVYTVILYLTDGVDSTAFPQFPLDEFAVPEFDADEEVLNVAALRATVERGCMNKERYDRWPVRVGDMAIFTQATMVCNAPAASTTAFTV